jgi:hypothetical protein
MLMTNSNLIGCITGRSEGFARAIITVKSQLNAHDRSPLSYKSVTEVSHDHAQLISPVSDLDNGGNTTRWAK